MKNNPMPVGDPTVILGEENKIVDIIHDQKKLALWRWRCLLLRT